jgi:hypothetical protein
LYAVEGGKPDKIISCPTFRIPQPYLLWAICPYTWSKIMTKTRNQHVVPNGGGGWAVKGEKAERATAILPTKQEAVDRGREIARNQGSELVVHGKNGQIQNKDSHGKDAFPPKG